MFIQILSGTIFLIGMGLSLYQLLLTQRQTINVVFALFCGSVAMMGASQWMGESESTVKILLVLGSSAICNVFWLVARLFFRGRDGVELTHWLTAASVTIMLLILHSLQWWSDDSPDTSTWLTSSQGILQELITLVSSALLLLSAWEAIRGLLNSKGAAFQQRLIYLSSYIFALATSIILAPLLSHAFHDPEITTWCNGLSACQIMLTMHLLLVWSGKARIKINVQTPSPEANPSPAEPSSIAAIAQPDANLNNAPNDTCQLMQDISQHVVEQQGYLTMNLKVADIARALDVPEYRISKALRESNQAKNFNDYVNRLRVKHACQLLEDPNKADWSVIVIGLESGFASVGPFTRAFKAILGVTPGQYRRDSIKA